MSDTPRTDAAMVHVNVSFVGHEGLSSYEDYFIEPDFARQLERELAETQSKLQEISITHGKWMADALQAGADIRTLTDDRNEYRRLWAEAKRDSARLDWLGDKCPATIDGPRITFHLERYAPSLRSSIDAAMEAGK